MRAEEKARWRAAGAPCWIDGQAIDYDAPSGDPNAFEVDHVLPVKTHPELEFEPSNRRPAHARCNRSKGAGQTRPPIGTTSEAW
jgi:hypothetical protein